MDGHPAEGGAHGTGRGLFFSGFGAAADAVEDELQQIEEDQGVDGEQADANPGKAAEDFEDLQGQERGGDGEGEELAPGLFEIEADAFGEGDGGIGEGDEADAAQKGIVEERGLVEDEVDQVRLGIEAEMAGEEFDLVGDVFVEQAVSAEADGNEEQRMEELVDRNEEQPAVVALARGAGLGGGCRA